MGRAFGGAPSASLCLSVSPTQWAREESCRTSTYHGLGDSWPVRPPGMHTTNACVHGGPGERDETQTRRTISRADLAGQPGLAGSAVRSRGDEGGSRTDVAEIKKQEDMYEKIRSSRDPRDNVEDG